VWWAAAIRSGGAVRWPFAAAETAPIDERDVASVSARMLTDAAHVGGDYVLTGPESISQAEQVRVIGDVIGRPIPFQELSPEDFRRDAAAWPPAALNMLLDAWAATMGHRAFVTSTVADLTGSPARTFRRWAVDHADAFR
jgi:uncharacterized protein YbjT (DUF2867 family)